MILGHNLLATVRFAHGGYTKSLDDPRVAYYAGDISQVTPEYARAPICLFAEVSNF